jgi:hypothetical protein
VKRSERASDLNHKSVEELSQSQREFIAKTAQWVSKNEEKFANLLQNSKDNERLRFLNEPHTPAGRYFLNELEQLKIQRTVREVCGGGSDDEKEFSSAPQVQGGSIGSQPLGSSISSLSREEIQRAGREAALIAMSIKRGLLASGPTYLGGEPSVLSSSPQLPSPLPPTLVPAAVEKEGKREKRNRWGPTVSASPSS